MKRQLFLMFCICFLGGTSSFAYFNNHPDSLLRELETSPDEGKTLLYHQIANFYFALDDNGEDSICGQAYALIYETEALLWEYYHEAEPLTMGNLLYNLSYYYSRIGYHYKALECIKMSLNLYTQHGAVDSLTVQGAEDFAQYCDTMANNYMSILYLYDSIQYVDQPKKEDSIISRVQTYFTAAHYQYYMLEYWDDNNEDFIAILKLLEQRGLDDMTEEQRSQLYYELVTREYDRNQYKEVIQDAKKFIEFTPHNEDKKSRYSTVLFDMRVAARTTETELEQLSFLKKYKLHEEYANMLFSYAKRLQDEGSEQRAEKIKRQAWEYAQKHKVALCPLCLEEISNQAWKQLVNRNYKAAADLYQTVLNEDNSGRIFDLANAMLANYRAGRFDKALEIEQCLMRDPQKDHVTYKNLNGGMVYSNKKHFYFVDSSVKHMVVDNSDVYLQNTSVDTVLAYNIDMKADSAQEVHIEAQVRVDSLTIEKQHRNITNFHADSRYLSDVLAFTQVLINQGDYVLANELCRHALEVVTYFRDVLPESYYAQANYYLAIIEAYQGDWQHMLECVNLALPYYKETNNMEVLAQIMVLTSQYYQHFYQGEKALIVAEEAAAALFNNPVEQYNPDRVFYVLINWAKCLLAEGRYADGYQLLHELIYYVREHQGDEHVNIAQAYMEFLRHTDLYSDDIRYAIQLFIEAHKILIAHEDELLNTTKIAHIFGKDYIDVYTIGAQLFSAVGNDSIAMGTINNAMRYALAIYGETHPYVLPPLIQQVESYLKAGEVEMALHNAKYGRIVASNAYGQNYWMVGDFQWRIAQCELAMNNIPAFELYADSVVQNFTHNIRHEFTFLTAEQRANYWTHQNQILDSISLHSMRLATPKMLQLAYDICLLEKGILLKTQIDIFDIIDKSNDEELQHMYLNLLQLNEQKRLAAERFLPFTKEQEQQKENLEKQIQQRVLKYGDYTQAMSIRWQQVKKALKTNHVAIEFISVPLDKNSSMYCALLLRKNSKYPELIPLFNEKEAMSLINTSSMIQANTTYALDGRGIQLSQVVWSKLLHHLKQGETVYFAATGLLHQLAIEALPYDETHTMSDKFNLVRMSSTREIVKLQKSTQNTSAVLYGGIQYATDTTTLIIESEKYPQVAMNRGLENDTLDRGSIKYLPGSKAEVEQINELLRQNHMQVQLFTSTNANEESFKAQSGQHRNIFQIATHGFYWSDSTAQKKDYFSQRLMTLDNDLPATPPIDPLNRCGMLFAGAQLAWSGHSSELPEGVQDGILTAKEISLLDLRDADLVVLSACETGKGEITGEGVFGLQRAFKQAGAQTIIMSLWPVNDAATQLLMTEFYRNWITNHQTKREAFRNAQNTVRAKYEEPVYWAGFIMLD